MKKLLGFLFGRAPKIFDSKGRVVHQHPDQKWKDWDNRYQMGSEFNWRNHVGMRASGERPKTSDR